MASETGRAVDIFIIPAEGVGIAVDIFDAGSGSLLEKHWA